MHEKNPLGLPEISRPPKELCDGLAEIGSATCATMMGRRGMRQPHLQGPVPYTPGKSVAGPALTLQFMPRRLDKHIYGEYTDREKQLHRHVLYQTEPGDMVVVDARGDMTSGIFGEMMLTYFKGQGGVGVVIDGCIRDWINAKELDLGYWLRGITPCFHVQNNIFPYAVNVPVAVGGVYVDPGDIIVADDDGAVVVPIDWAEEILEAGSKKHDWEAFTHMRLLQGGDLRDYYPLNEETTKEYEAWKRENQA